VLVDNERRKPALRGMVVSCFIVMVCTLIK